MTRYFCPTSGDIEDDERGGFDVCCAAPDLHLPLPVNWHEILPRRAVDINAKADPDIIAPVNELGEECPWPWEPQQLVGVPLGQYHCPYCGGMQLAGEPHLDHRNVGDPDAAGTSPE